MFCLLFRTFPRFLIFYLDCIRAHRDIRIDMLKIIFFTKKMFSYIDAITIRYTQELRQILL